MVSSPKPAGLLKGNIPRLSVAWEPRHRAFLTSLRALFDKAAPCITDNTNYYFRGSPREGRLSGLAMLTSLLWHIACVLILLLPFWNRLAGARPKLALLQIELTWHEPATDLPALSPPPSREKLPSAIRKGADTFHPRQTILSLPPNPNHPRQVLIQPEAPPAPPKIEPQLPNVVEWAQAAAPVEPRLRIDPSTLVQLRPRRVRPSVRFDVPVPEVANLEKNPGPLNIASSAVMTDHPKLPMAPAAIPILQPKKAAADAAPLPELSPNLSASPSSLHRLVALSATPAPPAPVIRVPEGSLTARLAISSEGKQAGISSATHTSPPKTTAENESPRGTSIGPAEISISRGSTNLVSNLSGLGPVSSPPGAVHARIFGAPAAALESRMEPMLPSRSRPVAGLNGSMIPEKILGDRQVFTLYVNMPNLTSSSGSWVLDFAELPEADASSAYEAKGVLSGPVPVRKVDPRYPPERQEEHVEGEVVLDAIIRADGSVDSIQLVKSLDPQLDRNAMEALSRWKFRPARRDGAPVDVEAVVYIPFRPMPQF